MAKHKRYVDFHWDTRVTGITEERMEQIRDWVDTLTDEQVEMLEELRADSRIEGDWLRRS